MPPMLVDTDVLIWHLRGYPVSGWRSHLERHRNRIRIAVHQSSDGQQCKKIARGVDGTVPS